MALYGKAGSGSASSGGDFEPCAEGPQRLVCADIVDLGMVDVTWQGQAKRQHKIQVRWQSENLVKDGKPSLLIERYTLSMHEKANLRKMVEQWRGRKFATDQEAEGFDIESLLGIPAYGNVTHNKSKDGQKVYANLASIMPMPRGMERIYVKDYERVCDREGYVPPAQPERATPSEVDDFRSDRASDLQDAAADYPF